MQPVQVLGSAMILLVTVGIGITAHELAHAAVLESLGVPYDIRWGSDQPGQSSHSLLTPLATVDPRRIPEETSTLGIRISAVAPLALTLPFVLVVAGIVPDPLASGNAFAVVLTIGWLACAIPSPQDFSVFWYADRIVGDGTGRPEERRRGPNR